MMLWEVGIPGKKDVSDSVRGLPRAYVFLLLLRSETGADFRSDELGRRTVQGCDDLP